jgi:hypothetical protein
MIKRTYTQVPFARSRDIYGLTSNLNIWKKTMITRRIEICKGRFTHSMPRPRRSHAAKDLECVFPIWFTQRGRVWFTLAMPYPRRAHAMLWPCSSSQGHGTARPSRDGLWATCPRSASSGYHAEFHEDCYQKHTTLPHNDPYLRL